MGGTSEVYLILEVPGRQAEFEFSFRRVNQPQSFLATARRRNHAMRFRYCFDS
jgi:hypothetical protein